MLLDDESLQNFWNKGMCSVTGSSLGVEAIGEFQTMTNLTQRSLTPILSAASR